MSTGLTPEAEQGLAAFRGRIAPIMARARAIKVHILVWGPGRSSKVGYPKRQEIVQHLRAKPNNKVAESEEISEQLGAIDPTAPDYVADELAQVNAADIVIDVITSMRSDIGAQGELMMVKAGAPGQLKKVHAFVLKEDQRKFTKTFLGGVLTMMPGANVHPYTRAQFNDCTRIREKCDELVADVRRVLVLEAVRTANPQ